MVQLLSSSSWGAGAAAAAAAAVVVARAPAVAAAVAVLVVLAVAAAVVVLVVLAVAAAVAVLVVLGTSKDDPRLERRCFESEANVVLRDNNLQEVGGWKARVVGWLAKGSGSLDAHLAAPHPASARKREV